MDDRSGMPKETLVEDITSYIGDLERRVPEAISGDKLLFFRGQASRRWPLVPKIARPPYNRNAIFKPSRNAASRDQAEWILISRFRDMTASIEPQWIGAVEGKEAEWRRVVLAQHHRLPTRLLDWTSKPLVALYFAVTGDPVYSNGEPLDSAVFVIMRPRPDVFTVRALAEKNDSPPCYNWPGGLDPGVFLGPDVHQRVTLQGSVFTISRNPRKEVKEDAMFVIGGENRTTIRNSLRDLGINEASLVPDLDGIARSLRRESETWGLEQGVSH